jgi:hypothetical protein
MISLDLEAVIYSVFHALWISQFSGSLSLFIGGKNTVLFAEIGIQLTPPLHCAPHIGTTTRRRHSGRALLG